MILPRSLRRSPCGRLARARRHRPKFLLNENEFREQANRERVSADRNGLPLAILIFALPKDHATERDKTFLATHLRERLRVFDTAGQLKGGLIAPLLPDTPKSGRGKWPATFANIIRWDRRGRTAKCSSTRTTAKPIAINSNHKKPLPLHRAWLHSSHSSHTRSRW